MRELKLTRTERTTQSRASGQAQKARVRSSMEESARAVARSQQLIFSAVKLLQDPVNDAFLGRRTFEPFSNKDDG